MKLIEVEASEACLADLHCDGADLHCDGAGLHCDGAGLHCDRAGLFYGQAGLIFRLGKRTFRPGKVPRRTRERTVARGKREARGPWDARSLSIRAPEVRGLP